MLSWQVLGDLNLFNSGELLCMIRFFSVTDMYNMPRHQGLSPWRTNGKNPMPGSDWLSWLCCGRVIRPRQTVYITPGHLSKGGVEGELELEIWLHLLNVPCPYTTPWLSRMHFHSTLGSGLIVMSTLGKTMGWFGGLPIYISIVLSL